MEHKRMYYTLPATAWSKNDEEVGGEAAKAPWCFERTWMEGFPIGNGRLAAMVWGDEEIDRLTLNHEWLWKGQHKNRRSPDNAGHLGEVRELIRKGDWEEATRLGNLYFSGGTNADRRIDPYQPAGDLTFLPDQVKAFISRELDLETGLTTTLRETPEGTLKSEAFIDCEGNTLRCRFTSDAPFSGTLSLFREPEKDTTLTFHTTPETIRMDGSIAGGIQFAVQIWAETDGIAAVSEEGKLRIEGATILSIEGNMATSQADLGKELSHRSGKDFDAAFSSHSKRFSEMMNRLQLTLSEDPALEALTVDQRVQRVREGKQDNGLCQMYFDYGRYLLLSSSICGELPANLQGKWNNNMNPPWDCDFHFDINIEMNYWMAEPVNFPECVEPLTRYILRFMESGRDSAERLYGCRGVYLPLQADAWAKATPEIFGWHTWIGGAPWISQSLWNHWLYSGDRTYLERIYPFLTAVAEFYEDYLVRDPDGTYQILPSQSPENFIVGLPYPVLLCQSSAMDVQLCYDALGYAISAAEELDVDSTRVSLWRSIREHLPPFRIGPDGRLLEWDREFPEAEPGHRHLSHLYGLYPSELFTPETRPEQYQAAIRSLDFRLSHGGGYTGWSRAWVACLKARIGDAEGFYEHFTALIKDFATSTLLDLHPPRVFQIDGNLGAVAAGIEALVGFYDGKAHLLPALPKEWAEKGSLKGVRLPGGHLLSFAWKNGELTELSVTVGFGETVSLAFNGDVCTLHGRVGETVKLI